MSWQRGQSTSVWVGRRPRSKRQSGSAGDAGGVAWPEKRWWWLVDMAQIADNFVSHGGSLYMATCLVYSKRQGMANQSYSAVGHDASVNKVEHQSNCEPKHDNWRPLDSAIMEALFIKRMERNIRKFCPDLCRETRQEENKKLELWGKLGF